MDYDKWDNLVFDYRLETNDKKRNKIFKELCSYYYPKFYSIKLTYDKKYWDDLEQIYMINVLKAIDQWKGINKNGVQCHFVSYLYMWTTTKVKSEIWEKYIMKDRREISIDIGSNYDDWFTLDADSIYKSY